MTIFHSASRCRVISISSARPAQSALALIRGQRAVNLAQLADSIRADRSLSYRVTEAACQELGCHWLSVEEAIVLLGVERICSLLSARRPGRSASQLRRALYRNHIAPAGNPCRSDTFQEEPI